MDSSFFFRVEHDLLRSDAFQTLGGSAIKVYLVIGLHADFGTGWAYPSIRTIARQAGLSRQTVLTAIEDLARLGLLATSKSPGRSTAYKIIRQGPDRPSARKKGGAVQNPSSTVPISFEVDEETVPISYKPRVETGLIPFEPPAQTVGPAGREAGPKREKEETREDNISLPIPGTPFRITPEGRLLVVVDLRDLLKEHGVPPRLAEQLVSKRAPEDVAKVLLNAFYLRSQGKLQNEPGYIRAGLEEGYELLPQVAIRLEQRRKELQDRLKVHERIRERGRREAERAAEEESIDLALAALSASELQYWIAKAVASLPDPIVRRNPTLSNPFVRSKVYELTKGEEDGGYREEE